MDPDRDEHKEVEDGALVAEEEDPDMNAEHEADC